MRVLVTGHQGYIGTVLVPGLEAAGHEVTGLDTGLFDHCVLGPEPARVPSLRMDVRDVRAEHCAGYEAVIHLAALSNDPPGNLDAELTCDINHRAAVSLAHAARAAGVRRFLFSSSCSLYGAGRDQGPLTEDAPFAPVTPYGQSKILAERDLPELATDDFSPVFARNATAYGFSPRLRGDLVVNDPAASALLTGEVRLLSDGMAWRPLVHAGDISAAFAALLEVPRERLHGKAYNIGRTPENYRVIDVARTVQRAVPGSGIVIAGGASADKRDYRVPCDPAAAEVPEFKPKRTLAHGVRQPVNAYRRHGLTAGDMQNGRYQRLRRIETLRAAGQIDTRLLWTHTAAQTSA
jgi:nucleoside-diphosphate-sugar epimerase